MKSGLRRAFRNTGPVPMGSAGMTALPGQMMGGNTDLALIRSYKTNGTVQSNVSLLASATASQDWRLFRSQPVDARVRYTTSDRGSDQRTQVVQHAALNVLLNPSMLNVGGVRIPFWDRMGLFEISQIYMEQCGKAYWIVDRGPLESPIPLGLWPVRPDRMRPVPDPDRVLAGWVYTSPDSREQVPLRPTDVIWNRYPDPEDIFGGCGPVGSVLTDIEAARYASEWNKNYFVNSAEPGGVIQADHAMDDEEFNLFINRWRDTHRGVARAHRIALLEAGMTWVPNPHSLKDMDFATLRGTMRDIIREALGMHKVMTGVTEDVNRANAQTGEEVFASWKIDPRLKRWRNVLNTQFLPLFGSTGTGVEFDYTLPVPQNREQDALELTAKANAALTLVTAGYDQHDVLEQVGLADMDVALTLSSTPALPPRWTAPMAPAPASPADGGAAGPQAAMRAAAGWTSPAWGQLAGPRPVLPGPRGPVPQILDKDAAAKVFRQVAKDYPPEAMAWMHHARWSGPVKVPLSHIEPDMQWLDQTDPNHVEDFAEQLRAGKKLKPLLLVKTPSGALLKLADGHHRYAAEEEFARERHDANPDARAFIGVVDSDHGGWETMHDYQFHRSAGGAQAALARQLAIWNAAGA